MLLFFSQSNSLNIKSGILFNEKVVYFSINIYTQTGTEPGKTRPVLALQTDLLNKIPHASTIICPLTTNIQKESEILRVHIKKGTANLNDNCDIMIDQVRAIDNKRLIKKLGELPESLSNKVKENLTNILDLY